MENEYAPVYERNKIKFKGLSEALPDLVGVYGKLHHVAMADGAIDDKTKELMALAISVHTQCEGCIIAHVKAALRRGANMAEIADTVGVAVMMGGGPAISYGGKALAIAKEFGAPE
jgi:AhpD family alkylhydroperoxidase